MNAGDQVEDDWAFVLGYRLIVVLLVPPRELLLNREVQGLEAGVDVGLPLDQLDNRFDRVDPVLHWLDDQLVGKIYDLVKELWCKLRVLDLGLGLPPEQVLERRGSVGTDIGPSPVCCVGPIRSIAGPRFRGRVISTEVPHQVVGSQRYLPLFDGFLQRQHGSNDVEHLFVVAVLFGQNPIEDARTPTLPRGWGGDDELRRVVKLRI
mmetsp:Transcript_42484/g.71759  ORF Transcript_42484/g.71759 Transcript_42484/m.71759 type:complete len:207 (-) Transcript_42484:1084-1704(-)